MPGRQIRSSAGWRCQCAAEISLQLLPRGREGASVGLFSSVFVCRSSTQVGEGLRPSPPAGVLLTRGSAWGSAAWGKQGSCSSSQTASHQSGDRNKPPPPAPAEHSASLSPARGLLCQQEDHRQEDSAASTRVHLLSPLPWKEAADSWESVCRAPSLLPAPAQVTAELLHALGGRIP